MASRSAVTRDHVGSNPTAPAGRSFGSLKPKQVITFRKVSNMKRLQTILVLMLAVGIGSACTSVDDTEWCVKTKFGKVKTQHMESGWNNLFLHDATCFDMTDQNFPEDGEATIMEAQTNDPVTVKGDVSVTFAFDPASLFEVFLDKRSERSAKIEIMNAIRSGYRNALAGWSVDDIFSERRSELGDSVKKHIQRLLMATDSSGAVYPRADIKRVFVRNIGIPPRIESARVEAARQAQILDQAKSQFTIDSVNARATVIAANAEAESVKLQAAAYASNPALLQLEIARAYAEGLAGICTARTITPEGRITETVAANCIVGGSIADLRGLPGINR